MTEYSQSSYQFVEIITKKKLHFIVVSITALLASILFSSEWFIKPKYKSFAIVYPANIAPYSSESETEQMLQLFQAADVADAVIKKFNLANHYGIDTTDKLGYVNLLGTYHDNVEINRTQYESIEINVLDTDPTMACKMVEEIIVAMNNKTQKLQRTKTNEVVIVMKNLLDAKKKTIDSVNAILKDLRVNYKILDYKTQAEEVTKGYMKALNSGKSKESLKEINQLMQNLEEKGGEAYQLSEMLDGLIESYNKTKVDYDNAVKELTKEYSFANIVTKPVPSNKKAYPIRWLIVLGSLISANLFLFIMLIIADNKKQSV